jgi:hypothetical protein
MWDILVELVVLGDGLYLVRPLPCLVLPAQFLSFFVNVVELFEHDVVLEFGHGVWLLQF